MKLIKLKQIRPCGIRIRFTDFRISVRVENVHPRGEIRMRVNIQLFIAFQITLATEYG
jgi:hypothetical protein